MSTYRQTVDSWTCRLLPAKIININSFIYCLLYCPH